MKIGSGSRYLPTLDGLRGISILVVMLYHAGFGRLIPGRLGVLFFFVISGFLITRLMLGEIRATGTLDILLFYLRRILRLLPTLVLFFFLFVPLLTYLGAPVSGIQAASAFFYFANYYHIYFGYPPHSPFPILWSLAVEEHFYIVFPFVIAAFHQHPKKIAIYLGILSIGILLWRLYLYSRCVDGAFSYALCGVPSHIDERMFHGTDSILDCILYGVIASLLLEVYPEGMRRFLIKNRVFYFAGLALLATLFSSNARFHETFGYTIQAISAAILIVNLLFGEHPIANRLLESRPLVVIGRWSYALYIYHFAVIKVIELLWGRRNGVAGEMEILLYLLSSFALAGVTYVFLEKPLQKLRRHLHPRAVIPRDPAIGGAA